MIKIACVGVSRSKKREMRRYNGIMCYVALWCGVCCGVVWFMVGYGAVWCVLEWCGVTGRCMVSSAGVA